MSLLSGLTSYWRLEEASGTRVDVHGSVNLTPSNSPGNTAGAVTIYPAANGYYSTATNMVLDGGATLSAAGSSGVPITFGFWFKTNSTASADRFVFSKGLLSTAYDYGLYLHNSGFFSMFGVSNNAGAFTTQWNSDTNWHFYTVEWNGLLNGSGGTWTLYKDNGTADTISLAPESTGVEALNPSCSFRIGGLFNSTSFGLDGAVDEFGVWRRILTATERQALYNNGRGLTYPFTSAKLGNITRPRPFAPGLAR